MNLKYILKYVFLSFLFSLSIPVFPEDSINFAAFYNNSGPQSTLDTFAANGAKLAADSINKSGGLLGKKLNIIFFDGKSDPRILAQQAQNVAKNSSISLTFGLTNTDMARVVIPFIAKANKLFITSGATSPNLPLLAPKNVFLACFSDDKQAQAGAEFTFYNLHARKILVIEEKGYEYAKILSNFYSNSWKTLSKNKGSLETILISKKDPQKKEISDKIAALKPDVIYIAASANVVIQTIQFLQSIKYSKSIMGGDTFDSDEIKKLKSSIYYTTHSFVSVENPDPIVQIFIKQYVEKFKEEPDSSFAALGFDTVYLLAHAVTLAQSTDANKIADTLHKIQNYHLITGNISYNSKSNLPNKSMTIIHVHGGKKNIANIAE